MSYKVLVIWGLLMGACSNSGVSQIHDITNQELVQLLENEQVQLVDVRTPAEVAEGTIDGAQNIDFRDDSFTATIGRLDKEKPIVVYCGAGGRSGKTSDLLQELGFKEIYDLTGGFNQWKAEDYPIAKP